VIDESGAAQMAAAGKPAQTDHRYQGDRDYDRQPWPGFRRRPCRRTTPRCCDTCRRRSSASSTARTRPLRRSPLRSSSPVPACASRKSRSAAICSRARPASGKTEVARQLAATLGVEVIRFDMSEYMERHTISRLGSALRLVTSASIRVDCSTDGVDQHPHALLLLGRNREGAPRSVQRAPANHGSRAS